MRLLLGLLLGLAFFAPPAVAQKPDKEEKKAAKEERKEPEARPAPTPDPTPEPVAEPTATPAPEPAPERTAAPTPAPAAASAATPAPTAAAPAPTAAPRRRTGTPYRTSAPAPVRRAPRPAATATTTATLAPTAAPPRPRQRPRTAWVRRRTPEIATVSRPPVAVEAVTRVIRVIPTPLRVVIAVLVLLAAALAVRSRRLVRQRSGLRQDLGLLQSALLPILPRRIGTTEVSAAYRPAEGLAAGGDFYDAFALDDHRTCVLVGDVAGHGRDAIPLTADARFTLRAYLEAGLGPRAALRATAEVLEPRLHGRLITVIVAVYDARSGRLTYSAAGHPPPLLIGVDEPLLTAGACPPIGAGMTTGLRQTTVTLPVGASACFHTDGLTDILRHGRRMGRAGLAEEVRAGEDAAALLERLVAGSDAQPDDMAACILRPVLGEASPAEERVEELQVEEPERARRFLHACGITTEDAEAALATVRDVGPVVLEVAGRRVSVRRSDEAVLPLG
jgi:hypothetical protein